MGFGDLLRMLGMGGGGPGVGTSMPNYGPGGGVTPWEDPKLPFDPGNFGPAGPGPAPQMPGTGGGGFGDFFRGGTGQLIGGALGGVGQYMAERSRTNVYKDELAFQRQKYEDERADKMARRESIASMGPIPWRQ